MRIRTVFSTRPGAATRRGVATLLLSALVALAAGCGKSAGEACAVDTDCASGLVCNLYSLVCADPIDVCETKRDCRDPARPVCGPESLCVAPTGAADAGGGGSDGGADTVAPPVDVGGGFDVVLPDLSGDVVEVPCPSPAPTMLRATTFEITTGGIPGMGLDVDGDPTTCAPAGACRDGVDNALAGLAFLANASIRAPVRAHELNLLLVSEPPDAAEGCFVLLSRFAAATAAGESAWTYAVDPGAAAAPCADGVAFLDACRDGASLTGGFGVEATFPLVIPLFGVPLQVPVHDARVVATVTTGAGGAWTGVDALVAGVVYKTEFDALLAQVPTDALPAGTDLNEMVYNQVTPDLDTDGDGTADAISVGLHVVGEPVTVTGFAEGNGG